MTGGRILGFAACMVASAAAQAGQVYGGIGLPGVMAGYAQPMGGFTLRGDLSTLNVPDQTVNEEGIDYTSDAKLNRLGVFADWFALGGWRLTGGITFNQINLDLRAQGNGGVINIGGTDYTTTPDDRLDVKIEFPKTTPYLGLGYGHHAGNGGFRLRVRRGRLHRPRQAQRHRVRPQPGPGQSGRHRPGTGGTAQWRGQGAVLPAVEPGAGVPVLALPCIARRAALPPPPRGRGTAQCRPPGQASPGVSA